MKKSPLTLLLVFGFVLVNSMAHAVEGWYFGAGAGGSYLVNSDLVDPADVLVAHGTEARYDTGINAGRYLGYDFGNNLRIEGEVGFRNNGTGEVTVLGGGLPADGDAGTFNLKANLFYDFDIGRTWKPYVGGGVGLAVTTPDEANDPVGDDDATFAYQVGAGIGFEVSPSVTLSLDYDFLATDNPGFSESSVSLESEDFNHSVGVRLRFGF